MESWKLDTFASGVGTYCMYVLKAGISNTYTKKQISNAQLAEPRSKRVETIQEQGNNKLD